MSPRPRYVLRVWMPDRPGALGAVASRVGAVGGDVVGIDIVDRGAGRAVDDLVVELPHAELLELLAREVDEVDGVDVEEIHPTDTHGPPHRLALLNAALELVRAATIEELLAVLVERTQGDLTADWTAVVDVNRPGVRDAVGDLPDLEWLVAFANGASTSPEARATGAGCDDLSWVVLSDDGLVLVTGRNRASFRPSERAELCGLGDIAAVRLRELGR